MCLMNFKKLTEEESHYPGYMQLISPILWMINYCKLNSGFCKELSISNEWLPSAFVFVILFKLSIHIPHTYIGSQPVPELCQLLIFLLCDKRRNMKMPTKMPFLVLFLGRKEVPEVPNVYWKPIYTVCFLLGVKKYLPISRVWKIFMTWNMWHFFTLFGSFWYLAFKVTKNIFFVKIEVCGKTSDFYI